MARQFNTRLTREALRERLARAPEQAPPHAAATLEGATSTPPASGDDRSLIRNWLTELHLLKGVPFNYLVPDIAMLPSESLRFFQVDNAWLDALLDGAFSLGAAGVAPNAAQQARLTFEADAVHLARSGAVRRAMRAEQRSRVVAGQPAAAPGEIQSAHARQHMSGFLLRSSLVSGWPGLEVEGFADSTGTQALAIVRMEQVAPALLLCLFAGVVAQVRLKAPGEAVHFGVSVNDHGGYFKTLRRLTPSTTQATGTFTDTDVPVALRDPRRRVIALDTLAQAMGSACGSPLTAAGFALQMVEGVDVVAFAWSRL